MYCILHLQSCLRNSSSTSDHHAHFIYFTTFNLSSSFVYESMESCVQAVRLGWKVSLAQFGTQSKDQATGWEGNLLSNLSIRNCGRLIDNISIHCKV